MAFVVDWVKQLGYRTDPFVERPSERVGDYLAGRAKEREKLNLFVVKQRRFGLLQGTQGLGKTTLLRWLAEEMATSIKDATVLFVPADAQAMRQAIFDLRLSALEKRVKKPQEKLAGRELDAFAAKLIGDRRHLILIDEAQGISAETTLLLKTILESCSQTQVLITAEKAGKEAATLGEDALELKLDEMGSDELRTLLERRIALVGGEGTHPFDDSEIKKLCAQAKGSPAKLLTAARERAIELALSLGQAKAPAPLPKKKWFSVRIISDEEAEAMEQSKQEAITVQELSEAAKEPKKSAKQTKKSVEEKKPVEEVDVHDVLQDLAQEMDVQERKKK